MAMLTNVFKIQILVTVESLLYIGLQEMHQCRLPTDSQQELKGRNIHKSTLRVSMF